MFCIEDHVRGAATIAGVLETEKRLREAVGLLTELAAPNMRAAAFLDRVAKVKP